MNENWSDDVDGEIDDWEPHGYDCDCPSCRLDRAFDECGRLPEHLGGGCQLGGTEFCDFECPLRDMDDEEAGGE